MSAVTDEAESCPRCCNKTGLPIELSRKCETEIACLTPTKGERKC